MARRLRPASKVRDRLAGYPIPGCEGRSATGLEMAKWAVAVTVADSDKPLWFDEIRSAAGLDVRSCEMAINVLEDEGWIIVQHGLSGKVTLAVRP